MADWKITSGSDFLWVRSLKTVNVSGLVRLLERNPHIEKLVIWCSKMKEDKELSLIKNLDSVSVEIADADDESVKVVSELTNLISLKVAKHRLTSEEAAKLSKCTNLVKLVVHESTMEQIDERYIKGISSAYVESLAKLTNLTELRLNSGFVNDEFVKLLTDTNCFHNLVSLDLSENRIGNLAANALAKSLGFPNLAYLNLKKTNIGWEGAIDLALSSTLKNLQTADLFGSDLHDIEGVEKLSQITYFKTKPVFILNDKLDIFYTYLKAVLSNELALDEILVGDRLCNLCKGDPDKIILKYLLTQKEKYQLRINASLKGRHRYCIFDYYLGRKESEKILFELGALPAALFVREKTTLQNVTEDNQSVHTPLVVKQTKFLTKYLVDSVNVTKEQVAQALQSFTRNMQSLLQRYQSNPILLKLLNLSDSEKRCVMENTLCETSLPSDKEFVESVIQVAKMTLEGIEAYSDIRLRYDYTTDDATVTIPQCIGYIKLLIDSFSVPLNEKIELLVTVMEQNSNLVEQKLRESYFHQPQLHEWAETMTGEDIERLFLCVSHYDRPQLYEWVKTMTDEGIGRLFLCVSGFDIEQTWMEQKMFVLLKHIFMSATAYGPNNAACANGIWSQIVASLDEIDSKVLNLYDQQLVKERDIEKPCITISSSNSSELAGFLVLKLIEYAAFRPRARKSLEDFAFGMIYLKEFEKITFDQQQILAQLNSEFTHNVISFLPNYTRGIPTPEEYDIIIENILKSKKLQDFAKFTCSSNNE